MRQNFPAKVLKAAIKRANGKCEICQTPTGPGNPPEGHHVKADWAGGDPTLENIQILGRKCCHRFITATDATSRAKADAMRKSHLGQKPKSSLSRPRERRPMLAVDGDAKANRLKAKHDEHQRKMNAKGGPQ